jgi:hypothetical protein
MADTKITALAAISSVDPAVDPLAIVDVSDTSMAASGTTKKITSNQILGAGGVATLASATITGAATFNGNTTLGDAQTDTATINGQLTARQGEFPSAVRAAASDYAAVTFDGATSGTRIVSTLTSQNIGTGDMSMWNRFRVFTTTGTTRYIAALSSSSTAADQASACALSISSTGGLVFVLFGSTTSDSRIATVAGFQTAYSGQVVDIVVTRTGTTLKVYINGTDTAYTETTTGTPPAWSATITSTNLFIGQSTGTTSVFTGRIYRSVVFNRALSASDVTELITLGVNPADQWGTQTAVYTSDFSAGADSWGASNGTAAGNIDGIGGQDNNLRYTISSGANNQDGLTRGSTVIPSKRYRFNFAYYLPSGQTQITILRAFVGQTQTVSGLNVTNAWTDVSGEGVVTGDTLLRVNQNFSGTGNGTDVFYIRAVTATRIGAIVDLDFTVGTGYQATDRSTNALHGTLFNGVEFTQPKRVAVLYATTNTNGNQQILGGTLAIPTNAIIEDIIVNSTGSATVSVGNASAGTQIVNGASVVSGRQRLTLATPFSTTGNLWVNSSSTATLQFTILYTIAS